MVDTLLHAPACGGVDEYYFNLRGFDIVCAETVQEIASGVDIDNDVPVICDKRVVFIIIRESVGFQDIRSDDIQLPRHVRHQLGFTCLRFLRGAVHRLVRPEGDIP